MKTSKSNLEGHPMSQEYSGKNQYEIEIDLNYKPYESILTRLQNNISTDDRYQFADLLIKQEFEKEDDSFAHIFKKVVLLNSLYSTNIFAPFNVALKISRVKNFSERMRKGDISLVDEIRINTINGSTRDFYSFSTKYCHHHNPTKYPIYDSIVVDVLVDSLKELEPHGKVNKSKMKDYEYFKEKVDYLAKLWDLSDNYLYTKLDKYLWHKGREER